MERNDRVMLTKFVAQSIMKDRKQQVDWARREGTVVHVTRSTNQAVVQWDGRKSPDQWPVRALRVVGG
jgi:hypothetical protein